MYVIVWSLLLCVVYCGLRSANPVPAEENGDIDATIVVQEVAREGRAVNQAQYPYELDYYISAPYYSSYPQQMYQQQPYQQHSYPQQSYPQQSYYSQPSPVYYYPSYGFAPPAPVAEPQPIYIPAPAAQSQKTRRRKYRPENRIEATSQKYTIWDLARK